MTNNHQPGILGCDALLALANWCEKDSNRSAVIEQDKLARSTSDNSSTISNYTRRNGSTDSEGDASSNGEEQ